MNDPNRPFKWLFVITLVALCIAVLYPPSERLKGGIDLVGGSSLLYEIDTTGLDAAEQSGLSSRVMRVLKDRVDPEGQMNLEWRPVGNTRLEVRMPRPPQQALERRAAYNAALDALRALNINRRMVEEALSAPADQRQARMDGLVRGIQERTPLIAELIAAHDEHSAAQSSNETATIQAASQKYEAAMSKLLATSLPESRLTDVLAISDPELRKRELATLRGTHPSYDAASGESAQMLTKVEAAYVAWAANKAELEDPSDLKRRLRGSGVLEFRILAERDTSSPDFTMDPARADFRLPISKFTEHLQRFGPRSGLGELYAWFPIEDPLRFSGVKTMEEFQTRRAIPGAPIIEEYAGRYYVLMYNHSDYGLLKSRSGAARWALKSAYPDRNFMTGENVVSFQLDAAGGSRFGNMTGANIGRQLCILLDGAAMSHATIRERITERCQISGDFTTERVQEMVNTLEAGSLPARLKETPLFEQTVGPSLGETNRQNGLRASVFGALLVIVFVLVYYGVFGGGVASIALCMNLLITLAIMSLMQATFTMPGIAGLLLSIGMAIDANVLIFERIREERERGIPFKKALSLGYDKAFSAIFDGNITTIITCVILGLVGSEEIKGFAITLGIGIAISLFTALTVTRLFYSQMLSWGILNDFRMMKLITVPNIDWLGLRRIFWPVSTAVAIGGAALFLWNSTVRKDSFFDIEFLGGTSVQIDLKPGVTMSDEEVRAAITADAEAADSAVNWVRSAAKELDQAQVNTTATASQFSITAGKLTGDQIAVLIRPNLTSFNPDTGKAEEFLVTNGIQTAGNELTIAVRPGAAEIDDVRAAVAAAADAAREAANRMRGARVQTVTSAAASTDESAPSSFEVVTVETNRPLVQEAILSVLGGKLSVQRAVRHTLATDPDVTRAPYFVIESDDHYLSDVIATDSQFDIRHFRGGVAVELKLEESEEPMTRAALDERIRQVGLQPEFEQFRAREFDVIGLGAPVSTGDANAFKHFALTFVDESINYEENRALWEEAVATTAVSQVQAALASEKSLSKVIQFAPQIAGQTQSRAVFAIVLAMLGIGAYVWLRFGTRDFGLAIMVTMVHDVCIVLGAIAITHWLHDTIIGRLLGLDDFRFDLTMLAAVLTIIGYQLNDTIVVFDRIRENKGRSGALNAALINSSINQTMSRTILTATLVTITVLVLYIFGGAGIHGFAYAMLVGTLAGTYSTVAIATPLVHEPKLLMRIMYGIVGVILIGIIVLFAPISNLVVKLVISAAIALVLVVWMLRSERLGSVGRPSEA